MRAFLIGFAFAAPIISIALAATGTPVIISLVPLFISHLLLLYPTLVPNSKWWGPVMTHFATNENEVWLTIDDGPSPAHTLRILELLKRFEVRATFFVVGERAERHPHLITEILALGHTLANHTFNHPTRTFWCAGPTKVRSEIDCGAQTLRSTPERPALYFRSPVGIKNMFVHPALARRGLKLIGWSVRGLDTVKRSPERVADRIEGGVRPGAIIVLHEGHHTEKEPDFNIRCLELTLQRLTNRGFRFVIPSPEQLRT